jgi:hypothetical protein
LDVIVEAAPDPVALETLPLAFVSAPVWYTAPAVTNPREVAERDEATACFPETHSIDWRPICPGRQQK